MDWGALERSARVFAGAGEQRVDGSKLLELRERLVDLSDDAAREVAAESGLTTEPGTELLVVDRAGWISGNLRTLRDLFGEVQLSGTEAKLVAWEGGAFVGLLARAVLAQYDPFRDQLIVVYPNLGPVLEGDGLRWLLYHEITHLAQFRSAPWMADRVVELGREILSVDARGWAKEISRDLVGKLPEIVRWVRDALEGKATGTPLLDLLPAQQRDTMLRLHAQVTLLEGHATYITDRIAERTIPDHKALQEKIKARRKRPPLLRLLEAMAGLDMKRQQYILGRSFCEAVWDHGGSRALAPAWTGPDGVPTIEELNEPGLWIQRVAA